MGIYDRQYYKDESQQGFSLQGLMGGQSIVFILIGINVAVFFLDAILGGAGPSVNGEASRFLSLSSSDVQPWKWFRLLTYGFAHGSPWHLFGNMLGLFFFGRPAEMVYGSKKFLWMYLTAILAGGVVWMIGEQFLDRPSGVLGASGGVAAVVILFCFHFPNQKVFLLFLPFVGIPAWIVGVFYVVGDLAGFLGFRQAGIAFTVHLAGAAYAYLFYRTRWDLGELIPGVGGGFSFGDLFKRKPNLKVHRPKTDQKMQRLETKADEILKKLHEQGEASLSARERKILEDYSRSIKQKNS